MPIQIDGTEPTTVYIDGVEATTIQVDGQVVKEPSASFSGTWSGSASFMFSMSLYSVGGTLRGSKPGSTNLQVINDLENQQPYYITITESKSYGTGIRTYTYDTATASGWGVTTGTATVDYAQPYFNYELSTYWNSGSQMMGIKNVQKTFEATVTPGSPPNPTWGTPGTSASASYNLTSTLTLVDVLIPADGSDFIVLSYNAQRPWYFSYSQDYEIITAGWMSSTYANGYRRSRIYDGSVMNNQNTAVIGRRLAPIGTSYLEHN